MKLNIDSTVKTAFKLSIPVLGAYWFLGITYGMLASNLGYSIWVPFCMAVLIYSGSVEFIALTLLLGTFHPISAIIMALTVGARHLFYGISIMEKWKNAKQYKPFLVFLMTDETFAINYTSEGNYKQQLCISVLDYIYWITGGMMGYIIGSCLPQTFLEHLNGLDFVVTAMFVAIFIDNYIRDKKTHSSYWIGIGSTVACLCVFGAEQFIIPTMTVMILFLYIKYKRQNS